MHRSGHSLRHRVWGIEADIQSLDLSDSHGGKFRYTTNNAPYNLSTSTKTDWLFTLRGRVGYAFNRSLVYFTGGLTVTEIDFAPTFQRAPIHRGTGSAGKQIEHGGWMGDWRRLGVWPCSELDTQRRVLRTV